MLIVITGDKKEFRKTEVEKILNKCAESEVLVLDDTVGTFAELEQYAYPSLFSLSAPVILVRFLIDGKASDLNAEIIKKLHASPTVFVLEEFALPQASLTYLKKHDVLLYVAEKEAKQKSLPTIFKVTNALTATDKKTRWFAYREALEEHSVEAIMGILYWKIRELVSKGGASASKYKMLYDALIKAHARAWQTGTPLALMIEKVILEY